MNIARSDWPRLLTLVEQALDMAPTERERWVGGLGLAEPLYSALLGLLRERQAIETGDFLGMLPAVGPGPHAPGRLAGGALVGPWRLLHEIGQGGMSTVWLAERADAQVKRQVALKLPHAGPGQDLLAARLLRERDILAALEHRNIARLYDVGVSDAVTPYLVMEYVPGTDLLSHADARRLTMPQRLVLFQQVLRAVQYAHGKLVLHRDLKPSNILVNEAGDVKLLDFGIAKVLADGAGSFDETELTRASGRQLTPRYASPEQLRGEALGTASDVYSMGVILFELLTGERPYVLPRDSRAALEDAVLNDDPRRPSAAWPVGRSAAHFGATAKALNRALRGDLDVIVLTALQKDPAQRYPTADAMAQDLQRHLAQEPILAQASSRWVRLGKFTARHAVAVAAGASVFAALSLGLGTAVWQGQQARQEANKANAIKDFLVTLLRSNDLDQDNAQAKRQQTVQSVLEQSATSLARGLQDQPEIRDELQSLVGDLLDNLNLLDVAIPLRRQRATDLAARNAPLLAQVSALRDLAESQNSQLLEARATLQQARALCERGSGQAQAPDCLQAQLDLGRSFLSSGDVDTGQVQIEAAASLLLANPTRSLARANAARTLGELRTLQGRMEEADALHQRAWADFEAIWGPQSGRLAMELRLRANQLALQQRFAEAVTTYRKAWQLRANAAGSESIGSANIELEMGQMLARVGQDREGEQRIMHASAVMLASQGPERAQLVFNAHRVRAEFYLYSGRLSLAGPELTRLGEAAQQHELSASEAHERDVLRALYLARIGQFPAALGVLEQRRAITLQREGPDADDLPSLDRRLLESLIAADELDAAEALVRERGLTPPDELLLARGHFDAVWPSVQARHAQMLSRPRGDQYQVNVVKAHEQMGIALAGRAQPRQAAERFQQAIASLADGYAHSPVLAALRARLGSALITLGETEAARVQLSLADAALQAEPLAGPQFRRPVQVARQQLAQAMKKV